MFYWCFHNAFFEKLTYSICFLRVSIIFVGSETRSEFSHYSLFNLILLQCSSYKQSVTVNFRSVVKFLGFSKDCEQNGDKMSKSDEKLPYLHWVTCKLFLVGFEKNGTLSIYSNKNKKITVCVCANKVCFSPIAIDIFPRLDPLIYSIVSDWNNGQAWIRSTHFWKYFVEPPGCAIVPSEILNCVVIFCSKITEVLGMNWK